MSDQNSGIEESVDNLLQRNSNQRFRPQLRKRGLLWRPRRVFRQRSEEHTSELQSLMRISYAVFCLKKKTTKTRTLQIQQPHKSDKHSMRTTMSINRQKKQ